MGALAGFAPSRDDIARVHFYRQALADLARALRERRLAAGAAAAARADGDRRDRARALAHGRQPAPPARMDHRRGGAGVGDDRPARSCVRKHWGVPSLAAPCCGLALMATGTPYPLLADACSASPGRCRRCGPGGSAGRGRPRRADALSPTDRDLPPRRRTRHLAPVRALRRRRGPPPAARQPADRAARHGRAPHLADQHRPVPAGDGVRAASSAGSARSDAARAARGDAADAWPTLPRHRGHFLNWYDTADARSRCCRSTSPRVDSGNLCTHLLARGPGLPASSSREPRRRLGRCGARWPRSTARIAPAARGQRREPLAGAAPSPTCSTTPTPLAQHRADPGALRGAARRRRSPSCARWLRRRARRGARRRAAHRLAWAVEDHLVDLALGAARRDRRRRRRRDGPPAAPSPRPASGWPREADFSFLYHRKRHLFHIGFRVAEQQLDAGFYDLLASEARATSLWAIAKGDVPAAPLGRARPAVLRRRRRSPACARGRARCSST